MGGIYLVPKKGTEVLKQLDKDIEKDYLPFMPRQPRLDAPGVLHHVMGRGIERIKSFRSDCDRQDFFDRVATLGRGGHLLVYAWALMPNHFHLLIRTGRQPMMEYSGSEVARYLGVTTSAVNRLAVSEELPDLKQYLKLS
jgi:REP element-mobilizing transposase RayT